MGDPKVLIVLKIPKDGAKKDLKDIKVTIKTAGIRVRGRNSRLELVGAKRCGCVHHALFCTITSP